MRKENICLFSSFFTSVEVPYYVLFYVKELKRHYDEFVFITNVKSDGFWKIELEALGLEVMEVDNEGYDFGMWYKAILKFDISEYREVALVNDSCILFRNLDIEMLGIREKHDVYAGMVISDRIATHLQSYFVVARNRAVGLLKEFFIEHGIVTEYREVIRTYEIGLSQHMLSNDIELMSLYNNEHRAWPRNPSFSRIQDLIEEGIPMIKKKIVFRNFRGLEYYWVIRMNFSTQYRRYVRMITAKYGQGNMIDFERVMRDAPRKWEWDIWLMELARFMANVLREIPGFPWLFRKTIAFLKRMRGNIK